MPVAEKKVVILKNNFLKYWLPVYIYAGVIFYISSVPGPLPRVGIPFFDKLFHIGEYALFGLLCCRALRNSSPQLLIENFKIFGIIIVILFGILDEYHQAFIPGRDFSIFDIFSDAIGGLIGVFIYGRYNSI